MNKIIFLVFVFTSCASIQHTESEKNKINIMLDNWHIAASEANYDAYFDVMTENAIFIGTDATENWNKKDFMAFAKPYFDKGKAWSFSSLERNIFFSKNKKTAWFNELLDTQMKICRGSGVLVKNKGKWKLSQFVLSMTIPNKNVDGVVDLKTPIESALIESLKK